MCAKQPQLTDVSFIFLTLISALPSFSTYGMFSVTVTLQPEPSPDVIPEGPDSVGVLNVQCLIYIFVLDETSMKHEAESY